MRKVSDELERCNFSAMNLENMYYTIDQHCMWYILRVSLWRWRKIIESSAEFLRRLWGV